VYVFSAKKKALQHVQAGYNRVMEARLQDALFFYRNDMKTGLPSMQEQTKGMTWLKDLGTLNDKAVRLKRLSEIFRSTPGLDIESLGRAALLCKADLLSDMVREKEFTSLQGIMGGYYAKASGENEHVAKTISEHYLPRFVGDELPKTLPGALLSIIDKLDNVVGAFLSGNRPSGSYDPLAVRRNGYAVVRLLDSRGIEISLFRAIDKVLELYKKKFDTGILTEFFLERMARYLQDSRYRYDEVDSVLATWQGNVADARMRCEALKGFRDKPEFVKLVIGQKRVRNILKGAKKIVRISKELMKEPAEKALLKKGNEISTKLNAGIKENNYSEVLKLLLEMRPVIDRLFDDVLVMCKEVKLRDNRLALVNFIHELFLRFADFSRIVIEGEKTQE
jgi:glycyl-tRNA synthetase beta chain